MERRREEQRELTPPESHRSIGSNTDTSGSRIGPRILYPALLSHLTIKRLLKQSQP